MTDFETIKHIYELTDKDITPEAENELKELLKPYKDGSIGIAQINTIVGDIEYNSKKVVKYIRHAQNIGLDMIIFPELTLIGSPLEDTPDRHPILAQENVKWLNQIAKLVTGTTAIVGFLEPANNDCCRKYYNSIAILSDGKIDSIIRKSTPQTSEFNDYRYIIPSGYNKKQDAVNVSDKYCKKTIIINNKKYGFLIGDDCLYEESQSFDELIKESPNILINCCADIMNPEKEHLKSNSLSFLAKKYSLPLICVNRVGSVDGLAYNGNSRVYDKNGELVTRARSFEEQFMIVNPEKGLGKIYPSVFGTELPSEKKSFSLDYEKDLERTYKTIIQGIRDYFSQNGFKRAVLGLSGGLDSTVCAVLLADAIGKENVLGVSMPSKITTSGSKSDAEQLAKNLGINFVTAPIKDMVETTSQNLNTLFEEIETHWDNRYKQSYTADNIQARTRAVILWGISNEFANCLPIATSDKSEAYMGYATINGDMSGGFAPIADVTKTKLFALARWLNKNREVKNTIPDSVIQKRPGAELAIDPKTGNPLCAEDALMPYEFMDEVIWRIENNKEYYNDMLNSEFLYEKTHKILQEQKVQWLDKFYRRMASAMYKWSIFPPSVTIDRRFIGSNNYRQPITSHINHKGNSEENIAKLLNN